MLVTVDSVGFKIINSVSLKALYVTYHQVLNDGVGMPSPYVYNSVILDRVGDLMYTINYQPDVNGWCDSGSERFLCYEDSVLGVYQKDTLPCSYTNVGIHETAAKPEIRVYPNPASRELIIESIDRIEHESALYDIAGRKMAVGKGNINVAALVDGMYFLEVRSEHGASGQKILVRH